MKRFLLLSFFTLAILGVNAQIYLIELKNGVTAEGTLVSENESTIRLKVKDNIRVFYKDDVKKFSMIGLELTHTQQTKKRNTVFSKERYKHEALLAHSWMSGTAPMINLNYIGGFYLNDYVFLGAGTGLDFSFDNRTTTYYIRPDDNNYYYYYDSLPVQVVALPLYAHIRTYFTNNKWAPFLAISGGMRVSYPKKLYVYTYTGRYGQYSQYELAHIISKYGVISGMLEIMIGVRRKINDKISINYQFGYAMRSWDNVTRYGEIGYLQSAFHGYSLKIGVSF